MSTYTTFQMKLQDRIGTEPVDGTPIYWVTVTSDSHRIDPIRCSGRSIREAFEEASLVVQSYIFRTCEDCADIAPEGDESMSNCGICLPCYDRMLAKRGGK
jgi:hypothetical protein